MKTFFTVFLFSLYFSCATVAQTNTKRLFQIFLALPDKAVVGLSLEQRQKLIENYEAEQTQYSQELPYRLHTVDHRNGFLGLDGAFEGVWQTCYWNLPNGRQLVGVYAEGCGPVCNAMQFEFYEFDKGKLEARTLTEIIPAFDSLEQRFLKGTPAETYQAFEEKDIVVSVLYKLPRRGKNIRVLFGNEEADEVYKPYIHGIKIELVWKNGYFEAGSPEW